MYEKHYSLVKKPFRLTSDPDFFFDSKSHKRALSYLEFGLEQEEGIVVVYGPVGTGKTTIANTLFTKVESRGYCIVSIVSTALSPLDFLRTIEMKLDTLSKSKSKSESIISIEKSVKKVAQQGKKVLLVIDEAQNRPRESFEEIRMLSNIKTDSLSSALQIFLLGQSELKEMLTAIHMEEFRQRITASSHLMPFTLQETTQYIAHRLRVAGRVEEGNLFTGDALVLIQKVTQGIPRKINVFADMVLLYGYLEDLKVINQSDVHTLIKEIISEVSCIK